VLYAAGYWPWGAGRLRNRKSQVQGAAEKNILKKMYVRTLFGLELV
jgi:hypothetical protein